jgi:hypothetical protein
MWQNYKVDFTSEISARENNDGRINPKTGAIGEPTLVQNK